MKCTELSEKTVWQNLTDKETIGKHCEDLCPSLITPIGKSGPRLVKQFIVCDASRNLLLSNLADRNSDKFEGVNSKKETSSPASFFRYWFFWLFQSSQIGLLKRGISGSNNQFPFEILFLPKIFFSVPLKGTASFRKVFPPGSSWKETGDPLLNR